MRLSWPFRRSAPSESSLPADTSDGSVGSGRSEADDAWRRLSPLAETIGPPPLVAPARPFAATLASSQPPAPILAPLSHGRSLEAPRGLVVGVARPTQATAGAGLPAPAQRSPLPGRSPAGGDGAAPDGPSEPSPTPAAAAPAASPSPVGPGVAGAIRRLPVADPAPATAPAALTRAPEPRRPAPLVGLVGQPRATGAAMTARTERDAAPPAVQRAPSDPPTAAPPAGPSPGARPDGPRLSIGQARRLGLGAPVAGGPLGAGPSVAERPFAGPAVRSPSPAPASPAPEPPPTPQRAPAQPADLPLAPGPASRGADAGAGDQPDLRSAASVPSGSTLAVPPTVTAPVRARPVSPGPTDSARGSTGDTSSGRPTPLVSAHPLRTGVQRAPLTLPAAAPRGEPRADGSPATGASAAGGAAGGAVRIHRGSAAGELATALDARSFTHAGEIYLPDAHGPLTSGTGRALLAHELTHVTQQRRLGSSLPAEHTPAGRALEAEAVAAERGRDLPLAVPASPAPPPAASPSTGPEPATTSAPTMAGSAGATALAQRSPRGGSERRTKAGGERSARMHTHTEQELEILAHQLYQRVGRHLRRELLVDRERLGVALDLP